MTMFVDWKAHVMTDSTITNSIIEKDVIYSDSITRKDVTNTDSSTETDKYGAKDGQIYTSVVIAAVLL